MCTIVKVSCNVLMIVRKGRLRFSRRGIRSVFSLVRPFIILQGIGVWLARRAVRSARQGPLVRGV